MKLNLGSNNIRIPGFLNVDHRAIDAVDIVADVFSMDHFESTTVDEIIACHILEHVPFDQVWTVVGKWYDVLKPGGVIWIEVPSLDIVYGMFESARKQANGKKIDWIYLNSRLFGNAKILRQMYGNEKYVTDFHKSIFTIEMLFDLLKETGFKNIEQVHNTPPARRVHKIAIAVRAIK